MLRHSQCNSLLINLPISEQVTEATHHNLVLSQLQPVPDNTNPLYIRIGNPALAPGFRSNIDISFNTGNREKFSVFDMSLNAGYNTNSFSNISAYGKWGCPILCSNKYRPNLQCSYEADVFHSVGNKKAVFNVYEQYVLQQQYELYCKNRSGPSGRSKGSNDRQFQKHNS